MLFKNRPVRRAFGVLGVLFVLFLGIGCFLVYHTAQQNTQKIVKQNIALVGAMSEGKGPEELCIITGRIDEQDYAHGETYLREVSYPHAGVELYPYYGEILRENLLSMTVWICACFAFVALLLYASFYSVYKGFRQLTETAERIVRGEVPELKVGGEGEEAAMRFAVSSMAEQLQYQNQSLQQDKEFLKNFLSDVSHQLKTPLSALRMYNEIMLAKPGLSEEKRVDFLTRSSDQIDRTDWLIQGLLKMARVEAGAVEMRFSDTYLIDTVQTAVIPFQEAAKQKGVALTVKVDSAIHFEHDGKWVAEALGNLVKNALEHTHPGGGVWISAQETPLTVTLKIQDNGEGMDSTEIPHIYERFYRRSGETNAESVGIGLSLARQIFEQNRGDIQVQSQRGRGSLFIVTFLKKS